MNQNEAFQAILEVLKNAPDLKTKVPFEALNLSTEIRKEMGFDSLARAAFFYELQDRFPYLEEEAAAKWVTLGDSAAAIIKR